MLKRLGYPILFIVLAAFFVWVVTNMAENSAGVFRLEKLGVGIGVIVFGSALVYLLLGLLGRDRVSPRTRPSETERAPHGGTLDGHAGQQ